MTAKTNITDTQLLDTLRKRARSSASIAQVLGLPAPFAITARLASLKKRGAIELANTNKGNVWRLLPDADKMASAPRDTPSLGGLSFSDSRLPVVYTAAGWGCRSVWDGQRQALIHIDAASGLEYIAAEANQSADLIYRHDETLGSFRLRLLTPEREADLMRRARDEDMMLVRRMASRAAARREDKVIKKQNLTRNSA